MPTITDFLVNKTSDHKERDLVESICGDCGILRNVRFGALKRTLKKRGIYRCGKCAANTSEAKAIRSRNSIAKWQDPNYALRVSEVNKLIANSAEGRSQRSKQSKEAWEKESFREFQVSRISALFKSEEHRKLVSDRNKNAFESNPIAYIEKYTKALHTKEARRKHKLALADPEYRKLHSELAIERFKSDEYKSKIALALQGFLVSGRRSVPESQLDALLTELGLEFLPEKAVGPYRFDAYVAQYNAYFEIQGEYWHSLPNNYRRDAAKSEYLRSSYPDAKLVCIWDFEFLTPGLVKTRVMNELGLSKPSQVDFDFKELLFLNPDVNECRKFLGAYHYAQYGKQAKFLYGATLQERLIQVTKIGPLSRSESAEKEGYKTNQCYELDRFCIHPEYHKKNFASLALTKATDEFFKLNPHVKALISFADSTYGHSGTIYKAAGWIKVGTVKPDYHYVNEQGWKLHKKSLYNHARQAKMTERAWAELHGWKKVFGNSKTKFILKNPGQ